MVLIIWTDPKPIEALKRLLARVGFLLIPLSIMLIKYFPAIGRTYSGWTGVAYNNGASTGKNGLGVICLVYGLAAVWRVLDAFRSEARQSGNWIGPLLANGILVASALWLFRMADSATSFICFLIGSGLMAATVFLQFFRKRTAIHLLVAMTLIFAVYTLLIQPDTGAAAAVGRDSTLTGRTDMWSLLLSMDVSPMLGEGYESFWLGRRLQNVWRVFRGVNQAHNGYLEVYLDLGWVGIGLLSTVLINGYRKASAVFSRKPEVGNLLLTFFVVAAIYNLTEHAFRYLHPIWIISLLATISASEPGKEIEPSDPLDEAEAPSY